MTVKDKSEMKEILHDYVAGVIAQQDAKYTIIDSKLNDIKLQTSDIVKRVSELEVKEVNHVVNCSIAPKVRVLEDNQLSIKSVKRWVIGTVGVTGTVMSIIWIVIKLISGS